MNGPLEAVLFLSGCYSWISESSSQVNDRLIRNIAISSSNKVDVEVEAELGKNVQVNDLSSFKLLFDNF